MPVNVCCTGCFKQGRKCSAGTLADVWLKCSDVPASKVGVIGGVCYSFFDTSSSTHGTLHAAGDITSSADCNACCFRVARKCSDGSFADVYMTCADYNSLASPKVIKIGGACYRFLSSDAPTATHGTLYAIGSVTQVPDCVSTECGISPPACGCKCFGQCYDPANAIAFLESLGFSISGRYNDTGVCPCSVVATNGDAYTMTGSVSGLTSAVGCSGGFLSFSFTGTGSATFTSTGGSITIPVTVGFTVLVRCSDGAVFTTLFVNRSSGADCWVLHDVGTSTLASAAWTYPAYSSTTVENDPAGACQEYLGKTKTYTYSIDILNNSGCVDDGHGGCTAESPFP